MPCVHGAAESCSWERDQTHLRWATVTFLLENTSGSTHGRFRKGRLDGERGFCKSSETGTTVFSELRRAVPLSDT